MVRPTGREVIEGTAFLVGLAGMFSLVIAAGADLSMSPGAPWWSRVLPIVVLAYFWPVCLPSSELRRRTSWPWLFRWPLETAIAVLVVGLAYGVIAGWGDRASWGILGGLAAALSVYFRGRIEAESRGRVLDRTLRALRWWSPSLWTGKRLPPSITDKSKWR
jgi:hypothetical protein